MVSLWLNLTLAPGSTAGGVIRGPVEFLLIATVGGGWTGTGTDDPPWDGFCSDSLTTCGWTGSTGSGLEVTSDDSSIGFISPMGWYSISVWGSTMEGRNRYWISTNYFPLTDLLITWESTDLRWLDWIFWGWYLPSLSINYVSMSKDIEKRLPQLYYIKMKISYDLGFIAIGVAMAT